MNEVYCILCYFDIDDGMRKESQVMVYQNESDAKKKFEQLKKEYLKHFRMLYDDDEIWSGAPDFTNPETNWFLTAGCDFMRIEIQKKRIR